MSNLPRTHITITVLKQRNKVKVTVAVADITHFTAGDKYITAHHPGGEMLLGESLSKLEAEFGDAFVRTHRSALVRKTLAVCFSPTGDYKVEGGFVWLEGVCEPIRTSRRHAETVLALVTQPLSVQVSQRVA